MFGHIALRVGRRRHAARLVKSSLENPWLFQERAPQLLIIWEVPLILGCRVVAEG